MTDVIGRWKFIGLKKSAEPLNVGIRLNDGFHGTMLCGIPFQQEPQGDDEMGVDHIPVAVDTVLFQPQQYGVVFPKPAAQAVNGFITEFGRNRLMAQMQVFFTVIPLPEDQGRYVKIPFFAE